MRKTASIIAFVLALVVCIGSVPMPDMQTYCYVEEETAAEYAESFIDEQIAVGIADNWNDSTQIAETVYTYDTDGYINGYIFNLETNGEESGYIVLDALDYNLMNVTAFGLENKYHLTDEELFPELEYRAIVNNGLLDYCYKKNNKYYDAESGTELTATKTELKEVHAENIAITNQIKIQSEIQKAENSIKLASADEYEYLELVQEVNLPNIESFRVWTMNDFRFNGKFDNHCGPTAIMNMMKYWVDCRDIDMRQLFFTTCSSQYNENATFNKVSSYVRSTPTSGTYPDTAFRMLRKYFEDYNKKMPVGDDYVKKYYIDWAWLKTQFANGNPMYLRLGYRTERKYTVDYPHAVLGVGAYYSNWTGNNYVRIVDGWERSTKNYVEYTYNYSFDCAWYYRWA